MRFSRAKRTVQRAAMLLIPGIIMSTTILSVPGTIALAQAPIHDVLLYNFENGLDGWTAVERWGATEGVESSTEMATRGTRSLRLQSSFSGTRWKESGAAILYTGGVNWTSAQIVTFDLFVPLKADDFVVEVFLKTPEIDYFHTVRAALTANAWNEIATDLSTAGDLSDVREFGIKIGTTITPFQGGIFIDNVVLHTCSEGNSKDTGAYTGQNVAYTDERVVNRYLESDKTEVYSFDETNEGWELESNWTAGQSLQHRLQIPENGVLELATNYNEAGWQEAGVVLTSDTPRNLSQFGSVSADIFVPPEAAGLIGQVYIRYGRDRTWKGFPFHELQPGNWNTITASIENLDMVSRVIDLGIKVGSSDTNFAGSILIDNVTLSDLNRQLPLSDIRSIVSVTPIESSLSRYEKFEAEIDVDADFQNPYDPSNIRVDVAFTSPSGQTVTVPGFYYQKFIYNLDDGNETLIPTNAWSWRVRFTPTEVGEWHYRVIVITQRATLSGQSRQFIVQESDKHGFLRIDQNNPHYLAFDDGSPYFAVGMNMAWYDNGGVADYDAWMDAFSNAGGNLIRIWMTSWAFNIEWIDTGLGNYGARQNRAFQLDQVMEMAAARDVNVMLTLLYHGPFSYDVNTEWAENPMNKASGGPLDTPEEFASNPAAIRLWHQKLRYIAARWGYSPQLLAWEWWNEVNWTPLSDPEILIPWITESSAYLRFYAPYEHLISISGPSVRDRKLWELPTISFVQDHMYGMGNLPGDFQPAIAEWLETYPDKPFLMAEFGDPEAADVDGLLLHLGLWSAPMNGAMGTGMSWWWNTYVHSNNLYYHFRAIARYFENENLGKHTWNPVDASFAGDGYVYGIQDNAISYIWIVRNPETIHLETDTQSSDASPGLWDGEPFISDGSLTLNNIENGRYTIEWWNTTGGSIIKTDRMTATAQSLILEVPPFTIDIALKVRAAN